MAKTTNDDGVTSTSSPNGETTPLIPKDDVGPSKSTFFQPIHRILLCGFLVSLSFGVTQVPLVYVFRVMTCEAYYDSHSASTGRTDRCSLPEIEAATARAVSLLGLSTTFFGVMNLFITREGIKKFGVKASLLLQVFWPAARLLVQTVGVSLGGTNGIIIVQCSQIITIVGGPTGYLLALNSYVADVTQSKERTGYLGRLQGCNMFGSAVGFLVGGVLADAFSIITPFQVALGLFVVSTIYVTLFLPYIPPQAESNQPTKAASGLLRAFGPLKSLVPAKWVLKDGRVVRESGPLILAAGVFLAVLATGYIPTLLQMYATDVFGFGTKRNSYLVSGHSFLRGLFLTLAFPRIIATGRHIMEKRSLAKSNPLTNNNTPGSNTPPTQDQFDGAMQDEEEQDVMPPKPTDEQETYEFDLVFTRFSLLVDGMLTLGATFVQQGWQLYLIGALLPLGAGTASAAKGTILQMCPASERTDALSAISLVEMFARLSTLFLFGLIFAALAAVEKTYLVFVCNAAVALFGFAILLLSRFPPQGSTRLDLKGHVHDEETEEEEEGAGENE